MAAADRFALGHGLVDRRIFAEVGTAAARHWTEEQATLTASVDASATDLLLVHFQNLRLIESTSGTQDTLRLPQFGKFIFALLLQIFQNFLQGSDVSLGYHIVPFVLKVFKEVCLVMHVVRLSHYA